MLIRVAPLLAILGVLVVPLCFGCGTLGLEETDLPHTENYSLSQDTVVTLLNGDINGAIKVEAWGKDYVELTWTRRTTWSKSEFDKADVKVTQAPGRLDIEGKLLTKDAKVSVDYEVKLPSNALLTKVTSGDGNIRITGISGDTVITAGLGNISVQNTAGYLDITAEKGKIRLEGTTGGAKLTTADDVIEVVSADGDINATNSNGGITINDCKGNMTLETSHGSIHVDNLQGSVLVARTENAPITIKRATAVEVAETSDDDIKAEISSVGVNGTSIRVTKGSISLYLSSDINADIELSTLSGDIATHSFWGMTTSDDTTEGHLKGTIGAGGNKIYVETSKGNIDLFRSEDSP
ncbi:MAG: DUF4097 family beta strand repeat protein [Dehalococcoidia bacterium]|nr:DUF4097 family beta strand repeat protein [Dehalococcoidia bacterium]